MNKKINMILEAINPVTKTLNKHKSLSTLGELLLPVRSEKMMRNLTFVNRPIDCLLFAVNHLKNGEAELTDALAWLHQGKEAFKTKNHPNVWDQLANAICLDTMVHLAASHLSQLQTSNREVLSQLAAQPSDHSVKNKLEENHQMLVGLSGYYLGHTLELNEQCLEQYNLLLTSVNDLELKGWILNRIHSLNQFTYLDPSDVVLDKNESDTVKIDKTSLQELVNTWCIEGRIPRRPKNSGEVTRRAYETAGLSVFGGPIALVVIPVALLGTPIWKIMDHYNYEKDQHKNAIFYQMLDDANLWIEANIQKQVEQITPEIQTIIDEVSQIRTKYAKSYSGFDYRNFDVELKETSDNFLFKKSYLNKDQVNSIRKRLQDIGDKIPQYDRYRSNLNEVQSLADKFLSYLKDKTRQLKFKDKRYHPESYECMEKFNNVLLSDIPIILREYEKEFDKSCKNMSQLYNEFSRNLNNIQDEIRVAVSQQREKERRECEQANNIDQEIRHQFSRL